jgi:hypothetical protein
MSYTIFLSYRRKGGYETAKHLYDLLSRDGYKVSFDIDTLRSGDFDTELLKRIEECTDFILILNKEAFDRCLDTSIDPKQDWLRNELAYAIEKKKNIIPVMLDGFTQYPENLPADIVKVTEYERPKYDQHYFNDFYRTLKTKFFQTPAPKKSRKGSMIALVLSLLVIGFLTLFFLKKDSKPNAPENLLQIADLETSINFLQDHLGTPEISEKKLPDLEEHFSWGSSTSISNLSEKKCSWVFNNLIFNFYEIKGKSVTTSKHSEPRENIYSTHRLEFQLTGDANFLWSEDVIELGRGYYIEIEKNFGQATFIDFLKDVRFQEEDPNTKYGYDEYRFKWFVFISQDGNSIMAVYGGGLFGHTFYPTFAFSSNEKFAEQLNETTRMKLSEKKHNRMEFILNQSEIKEISDAISKLKITFHSIVGGVDDLDLSDYHLILVSQ